VYSMRTIPVELYTLLPIRFGTSFASSYFVFDIYVVADYKMFCHAGSSAWNALPDFLKNDALLCLPLDASLNISTSHFTSTPIAFEVILQLTHYTNYLFTYLLKLTDYWCQSV